MERKRIIYLFLLVVLILVIASCHPRHATDIRPNMTKEEVVSLWGRTDLITYRTVDERRIETWEYHFLNSGFNCWITFSQDRVAGTQCRPFRGGGYPIMSNAPSGQNNPPPVKQQPLIREGSFAMKLAEALKIGEVKSEAEAESRLSSMGIAPRNGWIADYPMTSDMIGELQNAIDTAVDSGKLTMSKDEATKVFQNLMMDIENQYAAVEPPPVSQPYPEPYDYPEPYYYPYYTPYPYFFGGYFRFSHPFPFFHHHGSFGSRGFRGGGGRGRRH